MSIPLSFLLGTLGTFFGERDRGERARGAAMEVRALTGAGAERPTAERRRRQPAAPPTPRPTTQPRPEPAEPSLWAR